MLILNGHKFPNLKNENVVGLDLETYDINIKELGPGPRRDSYILGVGVSIIDKKWYFSLNHPATRNVDHEHFFEWFEDTFQKKTITGHNIMYDLDFLQYKVKDRKNLLYSNSFIDTRTLAALLNENGRKDLDTVGKLLLNTGKVYGLVEKWMEENGFSKDDDPRPYLWKMTGETVAEYGSTDPQICSRLYNVMMPLIETEGLTHVSNMESELIPLLLDMRYNGVRIDADMLHKNTTTIGDKIKKLDKQLFDAVGFEVNANSSIDMTKLFNDLDISITYKEPTEKAKERIKVLKQQLYAGIIKERQIEKVESRIIELEKGNPVFDKYRLAEIDHPVINIIKDLRGYKTLHGTFLEGLDKFIVNGRLHGLLHPTSSDEGGTVTGRFSMSLPNLQNQPSRKDEMKNAVRRCFLPEEGHWWCKQDLAQIEVRVGLHYAVAINNQEGKDIPGVDEWFMKYRKNPKTDYYTLAQEITELSRRDTKTISLGLMYWMGKPKLRRQFLLFGNTYTQAEVNVKYDSYNTKIPFWQFARKEVKRKADRFGWVQTKLGRRRRFPDIDKNGWSREGSYKAFNAICQGTAAEIMKLAMVNANRAGVFDVVVPLLTVHDELDISVPKTKAGIDAIREYNYYMENAIKLHIPVLCDIEIGPNWADVVEIKKNELNLFHEWYGKVGRRFW